MAPPLSRNAVLGLVMGLAAAIFLGLAFTCSVMRGASEPKQPVVVTVTVSAPGYSAEELEHSVTMPMESQLAGLASLRSLRSWSTEGKMIAHCAFDGAIAPLAALDGVRERLENRDMPASVDPPVVSLAAEFHEVARYQLSHDGLTTTELFRLHDAQLRPALLSVAGVRHVQTCGAGTPEVQVEFDDRRLESMGLSVVQAQRALSAAIPLEGAPTFDALGSLVLHGSREQPIRLSDVAAIRVTERPSCVCIVDGKPALCVNVYGLRADQETTANVLAEVGAWKERIPPGLRVLAAKEGKDAPKRFGLWTERAVDERNVQEQADAVARAMKEAGVASYRVELRVSSDLSALTGPVGEVSFSGDATRVRSFVEGAMALRMTPAEGDAREFAIRGQDLTELRSVAKKLTDAAVAEGASHAIAVGVAQRKSVDMRLNRERAASLGISVQDIARLARLAMKGEVVGQLRTAEGRMAVRIVMEGGMRDAGALSNLRVPKPDGGHVPLSELGALVEQLSDDPIVREDQQRVVYVRVWGEGGGWAEKVEKAATRTQLPAGVTATWRRATGATE